MITAPFNFVPLSEKVFFPDWAEEVSHDIPFEDGESGEIDITITAKSPIFIRDHDNPEQFCQYNGEYYIPATSVKGMVRNVLEIMSFSKMKIDTKTHQKTMSVRDMTSRQTLVGTANGCGLLKKNHDDKWVIVDYGKVRTIEYTNRADKTIQNENEVINCNFDTAAEKYNENGLYKRVSVKLGIKDLENREGKKIGTKNVATINNSGQDNAFLVLTGGIDNKKNEFIFADEDKRGDIPLDEEVVNKFKKVYFESDSVDGIFWKNNWQKEIGMPVFYVQKKNKITDIGLSQLFKLAYNFTVEEATKQTLKIIKRKSIESGKNTEKEFIGLDLAEIIFGTIQKSLDEKDSYGLKGRVFFSHFKADTIPEKYGEVYTVLGSPRPSFYPEYIQQNCKDGKVVDNKYRTLMDKTSRIAGWKRYPLHQHKPKFVKAEERTDSATRFIPLGRYKGDHFDEFTFSGKVRFHNLKKVELGALLSALTFHGNQNTFYHKIGMAKSLGFGKVKVDLNMDKYEESMVAYELSMNQWSSNNLQKNWIETEQIKELFTMAYKGLNIDDKLKYLKLDPDRKINEFEKAKKENGGRDCLPKCSELFNIGDAYPATKLTKKVLEEAREAEENKKEFEVFTTKLDEVENEIQKGKEANLQIIENFINNYPNYENIEKIKQEKASIERAKIENRHQEVNDKFDSAYDSLQKKKGNQKQYQKEKEKFIKKWGQEKNNKKSEYILQQLAKIK